MIIFFPFFLLFMIIAFIYMGMNIIRMTVKSFWVWGPLLVAAWFLIGSSPNFEPVPVVSHETKQSKDVLVQPHKAVFNDSMPASCDVPRTLKWVDEHGQMHDDWCATHHF